MQIFSVNRGRNTFFGFEHLAEIRGGIEAGTGGNLREIELFIAHKLCRRSDLDGIEIRDERQSEVFIESTAKMIF